MRTRTRLEMLELGFPTMAVLEIERLREVARAARQMPRQTPAAGACATTHSFDIAAGVVWQLDRAIRNLDNNT